MSARSGAPPGERTGPRGKGAGVEALAGGYDVDTLPRPADTTAEPRRVRMTRRMPWRHLAPDAVIVDRRSRWGNPYLVAEHGRTRAIVLFRWWLHSTPGLLDQARRELAGRDLACWCPLDQPCHADVLLEMANDGGWSR